MKKIVFSIVLVLSIVIGGFLVLQSFVIVQRTEPKACEVVSMQVTQITEGGVKDIVFHNDKEDYYYINRGLEQGLNLDILKTKVLNKTVTLHLAKVLSGRSSKHISQLALGDEVIYTEFSLD